MPESNSDSMRFDRQAIGLVGWLLVTFVAASVGAFTAGTTAGSWYRQLAKPAWTPPAWVFGPFWTVVFILMAIAAWLVWRQGGFTAARWPLSLYLVQLVLNVLWSVLFFGLERPDLSALEVVLLWVSIICTLIAFRRRLRVAAWLLVPYLLWITCGMILNIQIARMNP